jgi:hypothetical protein
MTSIMKILIAISLFVSLISALVYDAPVATPACDGFRLEPQGWSPKPTEAPSWEDLRKRQNVQGLITAPDGTCGYISGSSGNFQNFTISITLINSQ